MNREKFLKKWGTDGWRLLIAEFMQRAPEFPGDGDLANKLGEMVADLDSVLEISRSPGSGG